MLRTRLDINESKQPGRFSADLACGVYFSEK
jgi:hypothetical protein